MNDAFGVVICSCGRCSEKRLCCDCIKSTLNANGINEGLSDEEILEKIEYLSKQVNLSILINGTDAFCKNRLLRVEVLKGYL